MRIVFIAPFGLQPKGTVSARMLPLAGALAARDHLVRVVIPPWDDPAAHRGRGLRSASQSLVIGHSALAEWQASGGHTVTLGLPRKAPYSIALTYAPGRWALQPPSPARGGMR